MAGALLLQARGALAKLVLPSGRGTEAELTNNVPPSDRYILLAWGRDYDDVSPLKGIILGGGSHTVSVAVDVIPIED